MAKDSGRKAMLYTESQATEWLAWLARSMQRHGQTVFQVEQLQPSWLAGRGELLLYLLGTRSVWGVVSGLIFGPVFGLVLGPIFGLVLGLIFGPAVGLIGGLLDFWRFRQRSLISEWSDRHRNLQMMLGIVSWGLLGWLIFGPVFGLFYLLISEDLVLGLGAALFAGLILGPVFGLFWVVRSAWRPLSRAIQPVEMLQWSWRSTRGVGRGGLSVGLGVGFIFGLILLLFVDRYSGESANLSTLLILGLLAGLTFGLVGGLLGGLLGGLQPGIRGPKTVPNQGIRLSLRYAVYIGAAAGLIVGLPVGLLAQDPGFGLTCGLIASLGMGLWFGGMEVIEHIILRLILTACGHAPSNYARFLDYAAEDLNFLQKVGGGYMFIHRYLLEYFAGLKDVGRCDPNRPPSRPPVTTATGRD